MKGRDFMKKIQLSVKNLEKTYGETKVVNGISFEVEKGEVIGLLGANGAGKSTSIKMLTGIVDYDNGKITYNNQEVSKNIKAFQQDIGVVPQDIALYQEMSAYDNVKFFCSLYGYKKKELTNRVERALKFVGLWEYRKSLPSKFSGGMKRRLNIACSIAHSPKLLIMDEPTVGIDPQSRNHIMETIKKINSEGTTVIYVSHYMEEIETLCDRIILMDKGVILEDCSKKELKIKYSNKGLETLEEIFLYITGKDLRDEVA